MSRQDKTQFFDSIASKWDGWDDLEQLSHRLDKGLDSFSIGKDESVLDVGCGTGNLTRAILSRLSPLGRVTAVDLSSEMIRMAKGKISDPRATWHVADASNLPLENNSLDRIICFSVWPHFDDYDAVLQEFRRVLKPNGRLHVWHLSSRQVINDIHSSANEAVKNDILEPVADTRKTIEACGFHPLVAFEDSTHYLVSAYKPLS